MHFEGLTTRRVGTISLVLDQMQHPYRIPCFGSGPRLTGSGFNLINLDPHNFLYKEVFENAQN